MEDKALKILYIGEDNGIIDPLKNSGKFDIMQKGNGIAALRWLEANRNTNFDAILCNMFMRGVNGIAFYEEMRHHKYLQTKTPFILVSKNFRQQLRQNAYNTGLDDYYASPLSAERIYERVQ
jgi:CheY-like chemotaxis protein